MQPKPPPSNRILHISDLHVGAAGDGDAFQKLTVAALEHGPFAAVVLTGDIVDSPGAEDFKRAAELIRGLLAALDDPPFFACPGNHDFYPAGNRVDPLIPPPLAWTWRWLLRQAGKRPAAEYFHNNEYWCDVWARTRVGDRITIGEFDVVVFGIDSATGADVFARGFVDPSHLAVPLGGSAASVAASDLVIMLVHHHLLPVHSQQVRRNGGSMRKERQTRARLGDVPVRHTTPAAWSLSAFRRWLPSPIGKVLDRITCTARAMLLDFVGAFTSSSVLVNSAELLEKLAHNYVDLVLHGHEHHGFEALYRTLGGNRSEVVVVGCGSSTGMGDDGACRDARISFNVLKFTKKGGIDVQRIGIPSEEANSQEPTASQKRNLSEMRHEAHLFSPGQLRRSTFFRRLHLKSPGAHVLRPFRSERRIHIRYCRNREVQIHDMFENWLLLDPSGLGGAMPSDSAVRYHWTVQHYSSGLPASDPLTTVCTRGVLEPSERVAEYEAPALDVRVIREGPAWIMQRRLAMDADAGGLLVASGSFFSRFRGGANLTLEELEDAASHDGAEDPLRQLGYEFAFGKATGYLRVLQIAVAFPSGLHPDPASFRVYEFRSEPNADTPIGAGGRGSRGTKAIDITEELRSECHFDGAGLAYARIPYPAVDAKYALAWRPSGLRWAEAPVDESTTSDVDVDTLALRTRVEEALSEGFDAFHGREHVEWVPHVRVLALRRRFEPSGRKFVTEWSSGGPWGPPVGLARPLLIEAFAGIPGRVVSVWPSREELAVFEASGDITRAVLVPVQVRPTSSIRVIAIDLTSIVTNIYNEDDSVGVEVRNIATRALERGTASRPLRAKE